MEMTVFLGKLRCQLMLPLRVCIVHCKIAVSTVLFGRSIKDKVMTEREEGYLKGRRYSFQKLGCQWHLLIVNIYCEVSDPLAVLCRFSVQSIPMSFSYYILASS
jgi:hypothetical protein